MNANSYSREVNIQAGQLAKWLAVQALIYILNTLIKQFLYHNTFTFSNLADAFIQSDLQ